MLHRNEPFGDFRYPAVPSARSREGTHDLLDIETARFDRAEAALHAELDAGWPPFRDNARFADRRIAELEAQLLEKEGIVPQR
ncbi:hypothetical protein [Streptomyces sp. JJ38]|uniref:hypothetical protein n=1 Tax=Streptomyces sp. JJ38 TaxID=2738128 RepID=UPI001C5A060A|nr:hypothetical protein [Streptomyces sp. JJ38]MBW1597253.1 hypothetical protein [Streptomyces sp. JJ38]